MVHLTQHWNPNSRPKTSQQEELLTVRSTGVITAKIFVEEHRELCFKLIPLRNACVECLIFSFILVNSVDLILHHFHDFWSFNEYWHFVWFVYSVIDIGAWCHISCLFFFVLLYSCPLLYYFILHYSHFFLSNLFSLSHHRHITKHFLFSRTRKSDTFSSWINNKISKKFSYQLSLLRSSSRTHSSMCMCPSHLHSPK